jgi:imidazolonepropionase
MSDLVVYNLGQLVTAPASPVRGPDMRSLTVRPDAGLVVDGGHFVAVLDSHEAEQSADDATDVIDAEGRAVVPGFVDPHTHAVFAGNRRDEFARRLAGESYLDILKACGGIISTVTATRDSPEDGLATTLTRRLQLMAQLGTTTVEVKTGYGLDLENETKLLRAILDASRTSGVRVVPTFLGAHAIPPGYRDNRHGYVDLVIKEMLPAAAAEGARFCDVFCEEGAFTVDESRRILTAAKSHGLGLKIHADQVNPLGGAELAVELGARSADHLGAVSEGGVKALAGSHTAAVLLSASTLYVSGATRAPARDLIDKGGIVAIGTDFNPGSSPVDSMPLVLSLASLVYGLSLEEALVAATANAAYAVGLENEVGVIAPSYAADLLILDTDDYRDLGYRLGSRLIHTVISSGKVVAQPPSDGPL